MYKCLSTKPDVRNMLLIVSGREFQRVAFRSHRAKGSHYQTNSNNIDMSSVVVDMMRFSMAADDMMSRTDFNRHVSVDGSIHLVEYLLWWHCNVCNVKPTVAQQASDIVQSRFPATNKKKKTKPSRLLIRPKMHARTCNKRAFITLVCMYASTDQCINSESSKSNTYGPFWNLWFSSSSNDFTW